MALPPSSPLRSTALKDKTFKFRVDFYSGFQFNFQLSMFLVDFPSCPICTHLSFQVIVHMFSMMLLCVMLAYIGVRSGSGGRVSSVKSLRRRSPRRKASWTDGSLGSQSYTCRVFSVHRTVHTHTHMLSVQCTHIIYSIDVCTMYLNTCQSPLWEHRLIPQGTKLAQRVLNHRGQSTWLE